MNERNYVKEIEEIINAAKESGLEISNIMEEVAKATEEKTPNVIIGYHINRHGKIRYEKPYKWHIPKDVRNRNIQRGDIVDVSTSSEKNKKLVIVAEVLREEIEGTGIYYKRIKRLESKNISWSELERVHPKEVSNE